MMSIRMVQIYKIVCHAELVEAESTPHWMTSEPLFVRFMESSGNCAKASSISLIALSVLIQMYRIVKQHKLKTPA